jgi:hypothetical protein
MLRMMVLKAISALQHVNFLPGLVTPATKPLSQKHLATLHACTTSLATLDPTSGPPATFHSALSTHLSSLAANLLATHAHLPPPLHSPLTLTPDLTFHAPPTTPFVQTQHDLEALLT